MIDTGLIIVVGILYYIQQYTFALLMIFLAIISGMGAVLMALVNPGWYFLGRMQAGLDVDFSNPRKGILSLVVTKIIVISVLIWIASHVAQKAGYLG